MRLGLVTRHCDKSLVQICLFIVNCNCIVFVFVLTDLINLDSIGIDMTHTPGLE